jgi:hypothetical protein
MLHLSLTLKNLTFFCNVISACLYLLGILVFAATGFLSYYAVYVNHGMNNNIDPSSGCWCHVEVCSVANISEDHTAFVIRVEVRIVGEQLVCIGIGDGSGHRNWPVGAMK